MATETSEFRDALGCFATGITIVTAVTPTGELLGITANSFSSVSLDPPLVLFSLHRRAYSLAGFEASEHFAVNVLRDLHRDVSSTFATALIDKWSGVEYETWDTGCPIFPDSLASLECTTRFRYDGGDHVIFIGEVLRMKVARDGNPLLFFRGGYRELAAED